MKVDIRDYISDITVFSFTDKLKVFGCRPEFCYSLGNKITDKFPSVIRFLDYINDKRTRKIKIVIEDHDVWNADYTLAHIIHPVLVRYKELSNSTPSGFHDTDLPWFIQPMSNEFKWEYILTKMIRCFELLLNEDTMSLSDEDRKEIKEGLLYFSQYYTHLWI